MSGNDIVDITLAATESNWKRQGFLEKIFTKKEQEYINQSATPDKMVWRLWTMKESAYKVYTRQFGGRFFAPQQFTCTIITKNLGIVEINDTAYQTTTTITEQYIYSIANDFDIKNKLLANSCFFLPHIHFTKQQHYIYKKIIHLYQCITSEGVNEIIVVKDKDGIPFLNCGDKKPIPISITHHGQFAAFTIN